MLEKISFLVYSDLFCGLAYDLSWRMAHVHLKGMCILLLFICLFQRERGKVCAHASGGGAELEGERERES